MPARSQPSRPASTVTVLQSGELHLTYFGNTGWEITEGCGVSLVDPFLTQFARWTPTPPAPDVAPNAPYPADHARAYDVPDSSLITVIGGGPR